MDHSIGAYTSARPPSTSATAKSIGIEKCAVRNTRVSRKHVNGMMSSFAI